jgi:hypothetical protein
LLHLLQDKESISVSVKPTHLIVYSNPTFPLTEKGEKHPFFNQAF